MADYPALYRKLFNAQTDAIDGMTAILENLVRTHREAEQMYIDAPDSVIRLLGTEDTPEHQQGEQNEDN